MRTNSKIQDEALLGMVEEQIALAEKTVQPKSIYRIFDCTVTDDSLIIGSNTFKSHRLAKNLKGCNRVAIMAVTLGTESDRLLRSFSGESARLVAMQAVLTEMIEQECDKVQEIIEKESSAKTRQRYSPGYFDLDISDQKKIFSLLEITKRCGITLTDTCQMIPTKSVTAFTGIDYEN